MDYYIVTGASRGLGKAITAKLCRNNHTLFCISRKTDNELINMADRNHCDLRTFEVDLNDMEGMEKLAPALFREIDLQHAERICLVNNAGILDPIKPIGKCSCSDIIRNMQINAIAPMVMTSEFIRMTEGFSGKRTVINISSGAGRNPYYGWGCYCSSKTAIDMFTKCIGVEQLHQDNPVRVISFAPGIMDTDMQKQIRESEEGDFEQVDRFRKFKEEGKLKPPDYVAEKVIELINHEEIKSGTLIDIKELIPS